jgi:hypothetical protein
MKIFGDEIRKFYSKLENNEPFALAKFADGEWIAICDKNGTSGDKEWSINLNNEQDQISLKTLKESFLFKDKDYYVGISCPCCQGHNHSEMKKFCGQDEENLTYCNIFVNSNFSFFKEYYIPFFAKSDIYLVANKVTDVNNLPFAIEKFYPIDYNAWVENFDLISVIKEEVKELSGKIFLFSAGSFGNMLCYELFKINKNNFYIDIGSTLDPWTKANRLQGRYYENDYYLNYTCHWE